MKRGSGCMWRLSPGGEGGCDSIARRFGRNSLVMVLTDSFAAASRCFTSLHSTSHRHPHPIFPSPITPRRVPPTSTNHLLPPQEPAVQAPPYLIPTINVLAPLHILRRIVPRVPGADGVSDNPPAHGGRVFAPVEEVCDFVHEASI